MNKRRSPIWKDSSENFKNIVLSCETLTEILAHYGLQQAGGNCQTLKNRMAEENLSLSDLKKPNDRKSLKLEPLRDNSNFRPRDLKTKLIRDNIIEEKCEKCGVSSIWQGEPLVLHLDHINGVNTDNRLENLRLLCPNCHSQTPTFAGRNKKKTDFVGNKCPHCQKTITLNASTCKKCFNSLPKKKKIIWPSDIDLLEEIKLTNRTTVAKRLGVSEAAIRKHLFKL